MSWLSNIREGYGDEIVTDNDNGSYWQRAFPQPGYASAGEEYRAMNYGTALPEAWVEAYNRSGITQPSHYETVEKPTLEDYASKAAASQSKLLPRANEAPTSYLARISTVARALETLPQAEQDAISAAIAEAQSRASDGDHESLRARLESKAEGTNVGLYGKDVVREHQARQAATAASYRDNAHLGYQSITGNVPRVDLHAARQAESAKQAAAVQIRYAHGDLRPSGF